MKIKLIAPVMIIGFSLIGCIANAAGKECMGKKTKVPGGKATCSFIGAECVGYDRKCPSKDCTDKWCTEYCQEFKCVPVVGSIKGECKWDGGTACTIRKDKKITNPLKPTTSNNPTNTAPNSM